MHLFLSILFLLIQTQDEKQPKFEDYSVHKTFVGKPAQIQRFTTAYHGEFTEPDFQIALRKALAKGPNFADHYTIVQWADDTILHYAIIDAITGKVFFSLQQDGLVGLVFRRNSRLLISDPIDSEYYNKVENGIISINRTTTFYQWIDDTLKVVYSTQKPLQFKYKLNENFISPP